MLKNMYKPNPRESMSTVHPRPSRSSPIRQRSSCRSHSASRASAENVTSRQPIGIRRSESARRIRSARSRSARELGDPCPPPVQASKECQKRGYMLVRLLRQEVGRVQVYLAADVTASSAHDWRNSDVMQTTRWCQVKICDKTFSPETVAYFQHQMQAHWQMMCKNQQVSGILEEFETKHYVYIVLEPCGLGSIRQCVGGLDAVSAKIPTPPDSHPKPMKESTARNIFKQIVATMDCCHSNGIVLRGLSWNNVFLLKDKSVAISEVGDAADEEMWKQIVTNERRAAKHNISSTSNQSTATHLPPEITSSTKVDPYRADVWYLGVVLHGMLTGTLPFLDPPDDYQDNVTMERFKFPDNVSQDARHLLRQMLKKRPDQRCSLDGVIGHDWLHPQPKFLMSVPQVDHCSLCEPVWPLTKHHLGKPPITTECGEMKPGRAQTAECSPLTNKSAKNIITSTPELPIECVKSKDFVGQTDISSIQWMSAESKDVNMGDKEPEKQQAHDVCPPSQCDYNVGADHFPSKNDMADLTGEERAVIEEIKETRDAGVNTCCVNTCHQCGVILSACGNFTTRSKSAEYSSDISGVPIVQVGSPTSSVTDSSTMLCDTPTSQAADEKWVEREIKKHRLEEIYEKVAKLKTIKSQKNAQNNHEASMAKNVSHHNTRTMEPGTALNPASQIDRWNPNMYHSHESDADVSSPSFMAVLKARPSAISPDLLHKKRMDQIKTKNNLREESLRKTASCAKWLGPTTHITGLDDLPTNRKCYSCLLNYKHSIIDAMLPKTEEPFDATLDCGIPKPNTKVPSGVLVREDRQPVNGPSPDIPTCSSRTVCLRVTPGTALHRPSFVPALDLSMAFSDEDTRVVYSDDTETPSTIHLVSPASHKTTEHHLEMPVGEQHAITFHQVSTDQADTCRAKCSTSSDSMLEIEDQISSKASHVEKSIQKPSTNKLFKMILSSSSRVRRRNGSPKKTNLRRKNKSNQLTTKSAHHTRVTFSDKQTFKQNKSCIIKPENKTVMSRRSSSFGRRGCDRRLTSSLTCSSRGDQMCVSQQQLSSKSPSKRHCSPPPRRSSMDGYVHSNREGGHKKWSPPPLKPSQASPFKRITSQRKYATDNDLRKSVNDRAPWRL